jgi:hypothetical protein
MKLNNIFKGIVPILAVFGLASCKDSVPQPDFSKGTPIVELPVASLAGNGGGNSLSTSFDIKTTPTDYFIIVNYAAANANANDIKVTLAVDQATLDKYNKTNEDEYELLPPAAYNMPASITIPKGARKVEYHIQFNTTLIDPSGHYALPLKIVDASGNTISGNFGTLNILVAIKNAYDADYATTGYLFHPSSPRALKDTKHLATVSINTCQAGVGDLYGSNYYFNFDVSGTSLTNWVAVGSTPVAPASGFMNADNNLYDPAAAEHPGVGEWKASTYNNTYDPATKTFYMHYGYNGTAPNGFTRQIYEKWVRQ